MNGYSSLNRRVGPCWDLSPFELLDYSKCIALSPAKWNTCVKYATFLHFCQIISIKVVTLAHKCILHSIFYNTWLNRGHFSSKVLLPFVYRRLLTVDTKSCRYSNFGRLSEYWFSELFLAPVPALTAFKTQNNT